MRSRPAGHQCTRIDKEDETVQTVTIMPIVKPCLTVEEHRQLGTELAAMYARLDEIRYDLNKRYHGGMPPEKSAGRVMRALSELQSTMFEVACKDHPQLGDVQLSALYRARG